MSFARFFRRSSGKAVMLVSLLLACLTVAILVAVRVQLSSEIYSEFINKAGMAMRTLALTYADRQTNFKLTFAGGQIRSAVIPSIPDFSEHEVVDRTAAMIDGVATIFAVRGPYASDEDRGCDR